MRSGLLVAFTCLALWPSAGLPQTSTIRVGHFPNITHVQGLVAHHLTRHGRGWFEQGLGQGVKIEWFVYNAGPSAMEAILANSIDVTYVGAKTRPCSRPGSASCTGAGVPG